VIAPAPDSQHAPDLEAVRRSASRWKWLLLSTVLVVITLIWVTWFEITTHEESESLRAAGRRQGNLAISVSQYLTRAFANADAVAQYLASVHASAAMALPEQVVSRARANPIFLDMSICFEDGTLLSSAGAAAAANRKAWCRAWLDEAPPDARSFSGQVVRDPSGTLVPLITKFSATPDRGAGVIVLLIDVRNMLGLLQEYSVPDETVVLVTGADGKVRARWHSGSAMADQRAPEAALLPAVREAATLGQLRAVEGKPVLATARPMQKYGLDVLVVSSVKDTLAEARTRSFYYGIASACATVLVGLFALLLLRLQGKALRSAESLGSARQRLQDLNDELEEKVHARTAQLEAANRDLEAFSYTVAHDVRAPIAAIQGFADALRPAVDAAVTYPKAGHYLRRIVANAAQMSDLTESLLALGRLTRPATPPASLDLSATAREVVNGLREREVGARAVDISIQDGLCVHGDAVLMRLVLENLLGNAWKFSATRQPAVIAMEGQCDEQGWLTVTVRDNGEGFDQARAVDLFKPFRRMHPAGAFAGTGIGLATVERILRLHGGSVWLQSSIEGGTTAFFRMRASPH
jgi:signal transduction histidine kinase